MAFVATALSQEPRSHSIGPVKVQYFSYAVASADTSGTVTCDRLKEVFMLIIDGVCADRTAADSISGNVVTLAFSDPAATRVGNIIAIGR